jgi:uncharacterized protein YjbI with pentapeptide repeats
MRPVSSSDALAGLLHLNPWAGPDIERSSRAPDWAQKVRTASLERLDQGVTAWNSWATAMAGLRTLLPPAPKTVLQFEALAQTDFSGAVLRGLDLAGAMFPGKVSFAETRAGADVWLNACIFSGDVTFSGAVFERDLSIERSRFEAGLRFDGATLNGALQAREIRCERGMSGARAQFTDVWAANARLAGPVDFSDAAFRSDASFVSTVFQANANFTRCTFKGNAGFEQSKFEAAAVFANASFVRNVRFKGAHLPGDVGFGGAAFQGVFDFDGVVFEGTPSNNVVSLPRARRAGDPLI